MAHQTVSDWHDKWMVGGKKALRGAGRARSTAQGDARPTWLRWNGPCEHGPAANGYGTDLWTLARVAEVIEEVTGVTYHPGHVWRVLRQMGWSRQRPARAAIERDDAAVEQWVNERWPRVKKTPAARGAWIVFQDESGCQPPPRVRATWAPSGRTPVMRHHLNTWKRLSMSAAVCVRTRSQRRRLDLRSAAGVTTPWPSSSSFASCTATSGATRSPSSGTACSSHRSSHAGLHRRPTPLARRRITPSLCL